jgi:hypothetical protein
LALAAVITSAKLLYAVVGCAVMTIGEVPISMIGTRSFSVSNGRLGRRLGLAPWESNTMRKVVPSGADVTAACVPIEPDAPPRFSITIDAFRFRSSNG